MSHLNTPLTPLRPMWRCNNYGDPDPVSTSAISQLTPVNKYTREDKLTAARSSPPSSLLLYNNIQTPLVPQKQHADSLQNTMISTTPLTVLFPQWTHIPDFAALRTLSQRWRKRDAARLAATAARHNPHDRVDLAKVRDDTALATSQGLRSLLRGRQEMITERIQPHITVPPPTEAASRYIPPYPPTLGLSLLNTFSMGARIEIPHPTPPQMRLPDKSPDDHCAMERLMRDEHDKGLLIILPRALTSSLCDAEDLLLRISPTFIQGKVDEDEEKAAKGRKCDDYTASGMNTDLKAAIFRETYGAYDDPDEVTLCRLFLLAKATFPGRHISMLTSDYTAYYKRFPIDVTQATLLATSVTINDTEFVAIPLVDPFGLQDSNAHAKCATAAMHAINAAEHIGRWGVVLQTTYVDDTIAFGPTEELTGFVKPLIIDTSTRTLGPNGTNMKKTKIADILNALGFRYDCIAETIGLTPTWFEKLVCVVFEELPPRPVAGQQIRLRQLQRTASYMLRSARIITALRPFSRGIYRNISGVMDSDHALVRLTADSVIDILAFRATLQDCWQDTRCLWVPMTTPPLTTRGEGETNEELWHRQATAAYDIVHVDACTDRVDTTSNEWGAGWVTTTQSHPSPTAYGTYSIPRLFPFNSSSAIPHSDTINIYEFIAALIALTEITIRGPPVSLGDGQWHVHIWTDNTSCLSWMTSHKSQHPLIVHLLRTHSAIQVRHNLLLTMGHIPGVQNTLADAASRGFQTPTGSQSLAALSHLTPQTRLPEWWSEMPL